MLIDTIKSDIIASMKLKNQLASNILKVVISETQRANDFSDQFIIKYCKKLIEANNETLSMGGKPDLARENEILRVYIPKSASIDEIREACSGLNLTNDKKSIGIVMKTCKEKGLLVESATVQKFLSEIT